MQGAGAGHQDTQLLLYRREVLSRDCLVELIQAPEITRSHTEASSRSP